MFFHFFLPGLLTLTFAVPAFAAYPNCSRPAGSLVHPSLPAGTADPSIPIDHVIVMMQENRSFDSYFGRLNEFGYGSDVDGLDLGMSNPDQNGSPVPVRHLDSYCTDDTDHSWNGSHLEWDGGANDGFFTINDSAGAPGSRAMGFYDQRDIPYYYALANRFAIADRYFSSVLAPTLPNRFYFMAGTSFGHVRNDRPASTAEFSQPTIYDSLTQNRISWKYYATNFSYLSLFIPSFIRNRAHIAPLGEFAKDLAAGTLPSVAILESSDLSTDEHPPNNPQVGQSWAAQRIHELIGSRYWESSALFLTYDEAGGFFDHVPPPKACKPDGIPPLLNATDNFVADFDRYGFRVPFVAISPFAKRHFVSHVTYDHTSILKFIETKFNLPALSRRDANADAMLDLFDFANPQLDVQLPKAKVNLRKRLRCLFLGKKNSRL